MFMCHSDIFRDDHHMISYKISWIRIKEPYAIICNSDINHKVESKWSQLTCKFLSTMEVLLFEVLYYYEGNKVTYLLLT